MGVRVGIVVFVVDLNLRGTAAARWCEVGRAVGAASSLPGQGQNTCRAMQDGRARQGANPGPRNRGVSLDKLARQAAAQIHSLGTDFLSWNGSFKVQTAVIQLVTRRNVGGDIWGKSLERLDYRELLSDIPSPPFSFSPHLLRHIDYLSIYLPIHPSIYLYIYLRVSSKMLYVRFPRSRTPRSATAPQPLQRTPY